MAKKAKKAKKSPVILKIKKERSAFEAAKSKYRNKGSELFFKAVAEIFEKHEGLERFSWRQYTPNWNDGDACEFGCHFDSVLINDETDEDSDDAYRLGNLVDLLKDKEKSRKRIQKELQGNPDRWEIDSLNRDLKAIDELDFDEVSKKFDIKSDLAEIFGLFDEDLFADMFGEGVVTVNRDGSTDVGHCEHD